MVVLVLVGAVGQSAGADPAADRERVRQQRAATAAKLKAAEATDEEVTAAAEVLASAERAAAGKAQEAARAQQRAESEVGAAEGRLGRQRRTVVERAVRAYAEQGRVSVLAGVQRPEDAARRLALAEVVQGRLVDAVDSTRAAVGDLGRRRAQQVAAAKVADKALRQAADARSRAAKAQADLDARIKEFQSQIDSFDAEEAGLTQLLATRGSRAAVAPPDPGDGPDPGPATPGAPPVLGPPPNPGGGGPVDGVSSSGFIWPVFGRLSSPFGPRWGRFHNGQDIAAPTGTPIKAAKPGVVIKAGDGGGYGNLTIIDDGGGFATAYAHQSRIAVGEGAQVQQGQVIGYVGSTGNSTGPHLHFEVRANGQPRNPRAYLP